MKNNTRWRDSRQPDLFTWAADRERAQRATLIAKRIANYHGLPIATAMAVADLAFVAGGCK